MMTRQRQVQPGLNRVNLKRYKSASSSRPTRDEVLRDGSNSVWRRAFDVIKPIRVRQMGAINKSWPVVKPLNPTRSRRDTLYNYEEVEEVTPMLVNEM